VLSLLAYLRLAAPDLDEYPGADHHGTKDHETYIRIPS
jgi:hypothetical protein